VARSATSGPDPAETERVLRAFTRDGRLVAMPARWSRKLLLLDLVAQSFEPGRAYRESQVDSVLRGWLWDPDGGDLDHVAVRRYLVDAGMLDRAHGYYWRIGATFDV
jgi:hypothetical protein